MLKVDVDWPAMWFNFKKLTTIVAPTLCFCLMIVATLTNPVAGLIGCALGVGLLYLAKSIAIDLIQEDRLNKFKGL